MFSSELRARNQYHSLVVVRMWQPPDCPVQVEVLQEEGEDGVGQDCHLEPEHLRVEDG